MVSTARATVAGLLRSNADAIMRAILAVVMGRFTSIRDLRDARHHETLDVALGLYVAERGQRIDQCGHLFARDRAGPIEERILAEEVVGLRDVVGLQTRHR